MRGVIAGLLLCVCIFGNTALAAPAYAQVTAAATIGSVVGGVRELIKELENSAQSLIEQGNNAAAQQQMLLSGILTKLLDQLLVNYGTALDKTVSTRSTARGSQKKAGFLEFSLRCAKNVAHPSKNILCCGSWFLAYQLVGGGHTSI